MEKITLSLWIIAIALQIALLVASIAIAQTLRRSIGIQSPSWYLFLFAIFGGVC